MARLLTESWIEGLVLFLFLSPLLFAQRQILLDRTFANSYSIIDSVPNDGHDDKGNQALMLRKRIYYGIIP